MMPIGAAVIARAGSGITSSQVECEMAQITQSFERMVLPRISTRVESLHDQIYGSARPTLRCYLARC